MQAQDGLDGCPPERDLIAPQNHRMPCGRLRRADFHRIPHSGGNRLDSDAIAARRQPLEFRLYFFPAIRGEDEYHRLARGQKEIEQPFKNRTAGHGEQDFGPAEAEPRSFTGGRHHGGPLGAIDTRRGVFHPIAPVERERTGRNPRMELRLHGVALF